MIQADGLALFGAAAGLIARVAIGLTFVAAGVGKVRERHEFVGIVANYRVIPGAVVPVVAAVLPFVEIAIGAGLATGFALAWSVGAAITLLLGFSAMIAVNIARGNTAIDCGCHLGGAPRPLSYRLIARNLLIGAASALALVSPIVPSPSGDGAMLPVNCFGAGLFLFLLPQVFARIHQISGVRQPGARAAWNKI